MAAGVPQVVLVGLPDAVVRQSVDRVRAAVVNAGASVPAAADHHRAVAGVHAEAGERLRPRPRRGGAGRRRARFPRQCGRPAGAARRARAGRLGPGDPRRAAGRARRGPGRPRAGRRPGGERRRGGPRRQRRGAGRRAPSRRSWSTSPAGRPCSRTCPARGPRSSPGPDLGDVVGQAAGRRAVEVAAAGGHHVFLTGPPGAGKTMLAERLPGPAAAAGRAGGARGDRHPLDRRHACRPARRWSAGRRSRRRTTRPRWPR